MKGTDHQTVPQNAHAVPLLDINISLLKKQTAYLSFFSARFCLSSFFLVLFFLLLLVLWRGRFEGGFEPTVALPAGNLKALRAPFSPDVSLFCLLFHQKNAASPAATAISAVALVLPLAAALEDLHTWYGKKLQHSMQQMNLRIIVVCISILTVSSSVSAPWSGSLPLFSFSEMAHRDL